MKATERLARYQDERADFITDFIRGIFLPEKKNEKIYNIGLHIFEHGYGNEL